MAPVRPVLHRLSGSNEMVQNAPNLEIWVQWSVSGAFIAKMPTQLHLANLGLNGASSASFTSTFMH
jgi:hypothetical protein